VELGTIKSSINGQERQLELLTEILTRLLGEEGEALADTLLPWLGWRHLLGGETLFRKGDKADDLYFVVSGRLRATGAGDDGGSSPESEVTRGQTIGEMEFLTDAARGSGIVAMRDSMLASLSRSAYEEIVHRDPQLSMILTRLLADRLRRWIRPDGRVTRPVNICLLAITDGIDASSLGYALARNLSFGNRVLVVGRDNVPNGHGGEFAERDLSDEQYRQLTEWLDEVESRHEFLIFIADSRPCEWTRRCIRGSDEVVLLARADSSPALRPVEAYLDDTDLGTGVRRTLVLLHDEKARMPSGTSQWLACRAVAAHIHVRPTVERDIARLARVLSGTAIGLVLSGGGARGFAHLGVLKALEEFGVQLDIIGGASIGAVMAAYCAFDLPAQTVIDQARRAFASGPTRDFNLVPLISLIGGNRLRTVIDGAVVAATGCYLNIEDTWKDFFCVVANYTHATEVLVTRGDLAKWLRTSVSIPGVLPPVLHHGELMGDGGSFNNFPTDVMRQRGTGYVIGSDLLQRGLPVLDIEEIPSAWQLVRDRLRRGDKRRYRLPGLTSTLVSATMLVSQSRQREARQRADLCFTPALKGIGMLDWGKFDAIVELGYRHAKEVLERLPASEAARLRGADVAVQDSDTDEATASWPDEFMVP
jgi:NTE family protein